jgi:hypothetical protein
MYKDLKFPVLIVHRDIKADTVAGDRVRGISRGSKQMAAVLVGQFHARDAEVMFEYMQITKSTNENRYRHTHICHAGNRQLYCERV